MAAAAAAAMEAPYPFAPLPRPLDTTHGRTRVSPVISIKKDSRKRKRDEIAVAVDGEAVNLYNVQSQRLLTSYALPPQTYLCCAPCSLFCRTESITPARRQTFLAVRDTTNASKRRLVCYTEDVQSATTTPTDFAAPRKTECVLDEGDVIALDVLQSTQESTPLVVVAYKSGRVLAVTSDLSRTECLHSGPKEEQDAYEVEYASVLDATSSRRGVLNGREDVLALLDQAPPPSALLAIVVQSNGVRSLELYSIRIPPTTSTRNLNGSLSLLITCTLPPRRHHISAPPHYELHPSSGTFFQLSGGRLAIYDLSGTAPQLTLELGNKAMPVHSFARISDTLVLTLSANQAILHETKYGSIYSSTQLTQSENLESQSKKRKRGEGDEKFTPFTDLTTFSNPGLVIALADDSLVSIQLGESVRNMKRRRSQTIQLADAMGRSAQTRIGGSVRDKKSGKKWEDWSIHIDHLIEADDIDGLEKLVANDPKLGRQRDPELDHEMDGGDSITYEELWPLPEPFDPGFLDQMKVLYLLAKIFTCGATQTAELRLSIRIPSFKLLEWFALTGFLSVEHIQMAWKCFTPELNPDIRSGDVVMALRSIDDDFQLLHHLLSLPVLWGVEEVVEALRLLFQSFDGQSEDQPLLALPATTSTSGNAEPEDLELQSRIAQQELDQAMTALTSGMEMRSSTLRDILTRLHGFGSGVVTTALRKLMSRRELVFLVHVLRMELAEGGWTSQYVDDAEDDDGGEHMGGVEWGESSSEAIRCIADLLNCAVDAIGTSGWLVGLSGAATARRTEEFLGGLRAEVSAGLEGCYEASTIGVVLGELARYERLRLSRKRDGVNGNEEVEMVLPMGGGRANRRDTNGKQVKQSKIAHAQEKSRRVGKYEFDRIRI